MSLVYMVVQGSHVFSYCNLICFLTKTFTIIGYCASYLTLDHVGPELGVWKEKYLKNRVLFDLHIIKN